MISFYVLGIGKFLITSILFGFSFIPFGVTTCQRNRTSLQRNSYFSSCIFKLCFFTWLQTSLKYAICSCRPQLKMSSMSMKHILFWKSRRTSSMARWNVTGAFFNPNGIRVKSVTVIHCECRFGDSIRMYFDLVQARCKIQYTVSIRYSLFI